MSTGLETREEKEQRICCRQCGSFNEGLLFCNSCGAALSPVALAEFNDKPESSVPQVRPWVRYWARIFDLSLYSVLLGILIGIFAPTELSDKNSELALNMVSLFSWIFVESMLLSVFGTTPGKALFKTCLRLRGSASIPFLFAFYRSLRVWWYGLGAGFLLITWITMLHAEAVLSRDSKTSWDRILGFDITHEKIGAIRIAFAVAWFGFVGALTILAFMSDIR